MRTESKVGPAGQAALAALSQDLKKHGEYLTVRDFKELSAKYNFRSGHPFVGLFTPTILMQLSRFTCRPQITTRALLDTARQIAWANDVRTLLERKREQEAPKGIITFHKLKEWVGEVLDITWLGEALGRGESGYDSSAASGTTFYGAMRAAAERTDSDELSEMLVAYIASAIALMTKSTSGGTFSMSCIVEKALRPLRDALMCQSDAEMNRLIRDNPFSSTALLTFAQEARAYGQTGGTSFLPVFTAESLDSFLASEFNEIYARRLRAMAGHEMEKFGGCGQTLTVFAFLFFIRNEYRADQMSPNVERLMLRALRDSPDDRDCLGIEDLHGIHKDLGALVPAHTSRTGGASPVEITHPMAVVDWVLYSPTMVRGKKGAQDFQAQAKRASALVGDRIPILEMRVAAKGFARSLEKRGGKSLLSTSHRLVKAYGGHFISVDVNVDRKADEELTAEEASQVLNINRKWKRPIEDYKGPGLDSKG